MVTGNNGMSSNVLDDSCTTYIGVLVVFGVISWILAIIISGADNSPGTITEDTLKPTNNIEDYWGCTDCSGHHAGYDWAEYHDISSPGDCGGESDSFIEGCKTYAEIQQGIDKQGNY